jgi:hypothetical protein
VDPAVAAKMVADGGKAGADAGKAGAADHGKKGGKALRTVAKLYRVRFCCCCFVSSSLLVCLFAWVRQITGIRSARPCALSPSSTDCCSPRLLVRASVRWSVCLFVYMPPAWFSVTNVVVCWQAQLEELIGVLSSTTTNFVRCIVPNRIKTAGV